VLIQQTLKGVFIVKLSHNEIEQKAIEALRACLANVPFGPVEHVDQEPEIGGLRPDLVVSLRLPNGRQDLIIEVKANGQPRFARSAANQLLRYREEHPEALGVFVAPYISATAAEICTSLGIGYMDFAGNCHLCFGSVYIHREGKPNSLAVKRELRSLYSAKAERGLRVMLSAPKKRWTTKALSLAAGISLGHASNIRRLLADREWIRNEESGFYLTEPEQLLEDWAKSYSWKKHGVRHFYSLSDLAEIEHDIGMVFSHAEVPYALTGFSAAARLAPYVRYNRTTAYIAKWDEGALSRLRLKEVPTGANVTLVVPYDEGVFQSTREVDGIVVASPVQVYLDLLVLGWRGEEAAKAVLHEVLKPQW